MFPDVVRVVCAARPATRAVVLLMAVVASVLPGAAAHAASRPSERIVGVTPPALPVDDGVELPATTGRSGAAVGRQAGRAGVPGAAVGTRTLLVLRMYYDDEGWESTSTLESGAYSQAQIQSRLTGSSTSARAMFAAQSRGAITFRGLSGAAADVSPWLTAAGTLPRDSDGQCNASAVGQDALEAAKDAGEDPDRYDHVMIIFPYLPPGDCAWAGLGVIGGSVTWINGLYGNAAQIDSGVAAHELGHNLGVRHASSLACTEPSMTDAATVVLAATSCTLPRVAEYPSGPVSATSEYGDPFDMMGTFGYAFAWHGTELMSTWRRAQLLQLPAAMQREVTESATVDVAVAGASSGVQLVRIPRANGDAARRELAVEFRPASGVFDRWGLGGATGGVLVRLVPSLTTSDKSYLLDGTPETRQHAVGSGSDQTFRNDFVAAWRDAAVPVGRTLLDQSGRVAITVVAASSASATVQVRILPAATATPTPAPTSSPVPTASTVPSGPQSPVATPTLTPSPAPVLTPAPHVIVPTVLAGELLKPARRRGSIRLGPDRRIVVRFTGAARISASIGSRWLRSSSGAHAAFILPAFAVSSSVVRLRATPAGGGVPRTATLRIRRGRVVFAAQSPAP
jgi:hypothetical protein